ncbi:putative cobalt transport protein [Gloeothece citriformis PCC 7424]|uniref:Putative cobalt transport protein n=1 Tax=Gloeothece citriformis (strain PCC 7424) TaxID=65393 RepID=B7KGD6_GLOC7|nr:PDGLE domain-containing protein [Gloeothece citriformis]ACK70607.1 putative cobalt transport protein [Gloeothece citriformis PCC 7424]
MNNRNRVFILTGLGIALIVAVFLSPFASPDPDGLDRVSQDLEFEDRAIEDAPAKKLPFYGVFEEYALRGVPEGIATPLAGLIGTLATFGIAWGIGKLVVRRSALDSSSDSNRFE